MEPVSATGYSLDLELSWQVNNELAVNLSVNDLYHQLHWGQVTHTTSVIDRRPDKPSRAPSVSGLQDYIDHKQKFKAQSYLKVSYDQGWIKIIAGMDRVNAQTFAFIGTSYHSSFFNSDFDLSYYPKNKAFKLGLAHKYWGLMLVFDTLSTKKSNTLGVTTYLRF
ncbi:MAG: hypothetical protein HRU24_00120 [Gammaproteobacteria bacterium]|nr:hypothetical protein [Gammaproteobacteria bacterium]